ncbi:hypothetical protein GCM10023221_24840 [Luteimicrobium xylanilyticum]|nr:hypothetical protein [Luteimicrobium xylanilyticum]
MNTENSANDVRSGQLNVDVRGLRLEDEASARAGHCELAEEGFTFLPFFEADEPWTAYLARAARLSSGEGLPPGFVPSSNL